MAGSRRTATRVTPGAISLSSSSHFALKPYSKLVNPVALPPGRARLSTKPAPTGSATAANTIGTLRVACSNGPMVEAPVARMTSGMVATNSTACLRISLALLAQRVSMRTFWPMVQPAGLPFLIVCREGHQHPDAPNAFVLLRARCERPGGRRTDERCDELAPPHGAYPSA